MAKNLTGRNQPVS